ncbi:flagellar FlbD family protein [Candidatus Arthromitus sp. SFB-mouse-Japan]|uniref:flagellar FlbD family protein n=1 Tax=Candidatus Arthromitus sp. SFB-mouse TaxID=49118 RepID=UPI00021B7FCB|nr:flagellar FlbD family protein [Candidatus Arthromitus sp. SFB-mouse]EIA21882.1 flagellar FlbD family protein [Candidatus Arthromitus sp. SFB-3]EIA22886.1 flagellar FlbD family protein [Candidatus Arthromitus sp. SFB-1]EIA26835.1 flagellar FlbD family protein [Candidatus Arthromitus sp. SFB-5]EIA27129.1 flagellar FlbD family protein [Candidatus Arthromitus sp. SFB-co]EIA27962.1 flagellar FlbD family protein [Candidatus Arthromitus sp. SFB-4]EIA30990.1 flagellar FlbD family protein [Candidat
MIKLTRTNDVVFYLNSNEIERMELIPETALILLNGKTYIVKESIDEVIRRIIEFNRKIHYQYKKSVEN